MTTEDITTRIANVLEKYPDANLASEEARNHIAQDIAEKLVCRCSSENVKWLDITDECANHVM